MESSIFDKFENRYKNGDTPWELGRVDSHLAQIVKQYSIHPCKALDIGSGTGDNARWLGQKGFSVTGVDISSEAIKIAEDRSKGNKCRFFRADFINDTIPGTPYKFIFDRGCFHGSQTKDERIIFAAKAADCLEPGGLWLSLMGSKDGPQGEDGPPRLSAQEIVTAVEPMYEIVLLSN